MSFLRSVCEGSYTSRLVAHSFREAKVMTKRFAGRVVWSIVVLLLVVGAFAGAASAQGFGGRREAPLPDFIPKGYDDFQDMLDQLGIKQVRRGRDGRGQDSSSEATANPYKDTMPDLMTFKDGTIVTTAEQWPKRRAEIVEEFEREVYG